MFNPLSFISYLLSSIVFTLYTIIQRILTYIFSPKPPLSTRYSDGPKIAIIGAGLTGISAAAHCVSHDSSVTIFEQTSSIGGIWARVNSSSGLQIHSIMYRFHPSVTYDKQYPKRDAILEQVKGVWERYGLQKKTRFGVKVRKVRKGYSGWIINDDPSLGIFDGVIAAVGTCGEPKIPSVRGMEEFMGTKIHSEHLEGVDVKGKNVAVIGGSASAVEVLEYAAAHGAKKVHILSRSDKWIIPRNPVIDILLSLNIFGAEIYASIIPEFLLRKFFYRDLQDLAPEKKKGLWEGMPVVNSQVLEQIRQGTAKWLRGDIEHVAKKGIHYNLRAKGVPEGGPGHSCFVPADVIVYATGYSRPSLGFLPDDCFDPPPPNWYLQTFPPGHIDLCAENCTYVNAIGTVGHFHIGVYTRLLLMFLTDPLTRPPEGAMRFWVKFTGALKSRSPTKAFDFFTYAELCWWFLECVVVNPFRWKWAPFVILGWGGLRPANIVRKEKRFGSGRLEVGPW
ncbi:hypothetical protein BZA77DRAFT_320942 [Pyronema omphalodes]|nr:hypothetical protein BZA77DRAFT_320942 [Pyronema omphalodes]